jgi:aryl-alcohol dehydrogenase-like predicted oxidoreductase
MGILAWSPLAMGVLSGKYLPGAKAPQDSRGRQARDSLAKLASIFSDLMDQSVLRAVEDIGNLARDNQCTAAQLSLCWCLRKKVVSSAIVGAARSSQLVENIEAVELNVDEVTFMELDEIVSSVLIEPPSWYPGLG